LEQMGQKRINRKVPWKCILKSPPVWAALVSVVCHEFPLMTMIMFLPAYLHDVHHYDSTQNGIYSVKIIFYWEKISQNFPGSPNFSSLDKQNYFKLA